MDNEIINQDIAQTKALDAASNTIVQEQLNMNQLLGRVQATQAIATLLDTLSLAQIAQIKEGKEYRNFQGQVVVVDGEEVRLDTWEGFCKAIGSSRENIDLKLSNLRLLGESALNRAHALGMTTRELRRLRKLDDADQKVIIGELEAAVGDKEEIIDLITEMSAKHARDREALQNQLDEQKAEAAASARIIADKSKMIDDLKRKIIKQESRTLDDAIEAEVFAMDQAMVACLKPLPGLSDAIAAIIQRDDPALTLRAADTLRELRTAIETIQIEHGLENIEAPDDSWMADIPEDVEEQPLR